MWKSPSRKSPIPSVSLCNKNNVTEVHREYPELHRGMEKEEQYDGGIVDEWASEQMPPSLLTHNS
jgi:hypothetical protein